MALMPGRRATRNPQPNGGVKRVTLRRRAAVLLQLALLFGAALPGCQWFHPRGSGLFGGGWPWRQQQPCVLPPEVPTPQLVEHLNGNIARVRAWRCAGAQVRIEGAPASLSAQIAVENPKNFRMVISSTLTGPEADLGSNGERLWFWTRRSQPELIYTARHDQLHQLRGRVPLPFQPEWLMEVLGVVPIDASTITARKPVEGQRLVRLISDQTSLDGQPVRRQIVVDTCRGHIVAHELFDASDQLIARATLGDYRVDAPGGVAVPHKLDVKWPSAQMAMSMSLRRVDVNPQVMPASLWQLPENRNSTPYDVVLQKPIDRTAIAPAAGAAPVFAHPPAIPARTASQRSPFELEEREDPAFAPREPRPAWAGGE
jgi:hypothetical protein